MAQSFHYCSPPTPYKNRSLPLTVPYPDTNSYCWNRRQIRICSTTPDLAPDQESCFVARNIGPRQVDLREGDDDRLQICRWRGIPTGVVALASAVAAESVTALKDVTR
jgi:hypothetical protein